MGQIEILAHRGWWDQPEDHNSPKALRRAFAAGLGVETDLRDCAGEIVVSHDPPAAGGVACLSLRALLEMHAAAGKPGTLALNIKSDGLQTAVNALLREFRVRRYFVFDMSVPDTLAWLKAGCRVFTRQSEYELQPSVFDQCAGVWLDAFKSEWYDRGIITGHLAAGKQVAVVSPELHGRDPLAVWDMLHSFPGAGILICTDRVDEARRYFHG